MLKIEVELKTETIFNSGESDSNIVQTKALTDADGFVYFHSKTLKGQLKDRAFWLYDRYSESKDGEEKAKKMANAIAYLFGIEEQELISRYPNVKNSDKDPESEKFEGFIKSLDYDLYPTFQKDPLYCEGHLKIGCLEFSQEFKEMFNQLKKAEDRTSEEYIRFSNDALIKAQTNIRTSISIGENGVTKDKFLGKYHTVRAGFKFESKLDFISGNDAKVDVSKFEPELNMIVMALDRIGANTNRGRGKVSSRLINTELKEGSSL